MADTLPDSRETQQPACRLCGGGLSLRFSLRVLQKHDVAYLKCEQCSSLQTEPPHWLAEAYGDSNLSNLDTGAAQRNLQNLAACWSIAKLLRLKDVLDIGGGDGLLCRLLRDYEINCFVRDKYASPTYAQGFESPSFATAELVLAFEVLEHYPEPRHDLDELFKDRPKAILASTCIYKNQGEDWWYFAPESGQHVFFYSRQALQMVAAKHDYQLLISGGYSLFLQRGMFGVLKRVLARIMLKSGVRRFTKALIVMGSARGVHKDRLLQIEKSKARTRA